MPVLFISSTGDHAGQSLTAWAIGRRLSEKGVRIGFLKPFGTKLIRVHNRWIDSDAVLFKEAFKLRETLDAICPFMTSEAIGVHRGPLDLMKSVQSLAQERLMEIDLLIVLGAKHIFFDDVPYPLPDITMINELNADLILTHRFKKVSTSLYSILSVISLLKKKVKGVIINRVPGDQFEDTQGKIVPALIQNGISNAVLLHEDPVLSLWSLREILDVLHGKLIWGEEFLDRPVDGMTVGTSDLHGDLLLFKRVYNKVILLGPSRMPLESRDQTGSRAIAGILLTGDREPAEKVLEIAKKAKIPLILIKDDNFSVKEHLDLNTPTLVPSDQDKLLHFTNMMDQDDSLNRLIQTLSIS
ncbi:MAG: AAA family ATPase [Deltaproteobacteria bacterium]|nr:AAA family ATPase [Deltaproteobacteria bacterium]